MSGKSLNSTNKKILKAINDPSRYTIIKLLIENGGTLCVNEIATRVDITPSAVSHQLSKLEDLGMVKPNRTGQNVCYYLEDNKVSAKLKNLIDLLESS